MRKRDQLIKIKMLSSLAFIVVSLFMANNQAVAADDINYYIAVK